MWKESRKWANADSNNWVSLLLRTRKDIHLVKGVQRARKTFSFRSFYQTQILMCQVEKGQGRYAFFMESASIEYLKERRCNLSQVNTRTQKDKKTKDKKTKRMHRVSEREAVQSQVSLVTQVPMRVADQLPKLKRTLTLYYCHTR